MDSTSQKCLQQAIDTEIKSLEEYIRALKSRRNTLSPISSLPLEVFTAIFSFACLPGIPSPGKKPGYHPARPYVSHICHQWREIAFNQPLLWNHVDFTTLSWAGATEILVRSKSVPLYLKSRGSYHRWRDNQYCRLGKELQAHILRICHLTLSATPTLLECTLEELVSPAPTLECLSLSSRGEYQKLDVPNTLFNGHTPKLSCLELRNCNINWKSPLLKGLEYLEIINPSMTPSLVVWLDVLNEMSQLKKLTLHPASPNSPPLPFNVERAVMLPSLTHLDFSASVGDCALTLAHLDLPVLTRLCLTVILHRDSCNVQGILPYVARHAHGPQDMQPLQSLLIRNGSHNYLDILAWPVPDIDIEVHDPPALLGVALPPRVALSFMRSYHGGHDNQPEILDAVMTALPLDGLVLLTALYRGVGQDSELDPSTPQFWLRHSPKWPLLRRVRLGYYGERGFVAMLEADGGREIPLLPSLTELVLISAELSPRSTRCLCDALMRRVEQGAPLQRLDLRAFYRSHYDPADLRLLSEIVVDVLAPASEIAFDLTADFDPEGFDAMAKEMNRMKLLWEDLIHGPFPFLEDDDEDNDSEDEDDE